MIAAAFQNIPGSAPKTRRGMKHGGGGLLCALQDHGPESDYQILPYLDGNIWLSKEFFRCLVYPIL